jgi:hypothetical protein
MLVDGGAAVYLMLYFVFKKLGREDGKLMKANLTLNGVGWGGNSMDAKSVASRELSMGSKSLTTTFFVVEVRGNYSIILGHYWTHTNQCVPSTLHQVLIQ